MHRGHDHDHVNGMGGGAAHPALPRHGMGHNRGEPAAVAQWQTPHLKPGEGAQVMAEQRDLDQVEASFVEGFATASDPTSFLRLADIPFEMTASDGAHLVLLRIEIDSLADVGSITPHFGGAAFRYDPLPAALVSKRRRLRFVYFDGRALRSLNFSDVREGARRPDPAP